MLLPDSSLAIIAEKFILGLALAAPIGPVSLEMIKRGLNNGFFAAFNIRIGGVIGNVFCLTIAYIGLAHIIAYPSVSTALSVMGALMLFYMGITNWSKSVSSVTPENEEEQEEQEEQEDKKFDTKSSLKLGIILAVLNPIAFAFWPGVFAMSMVNGDSSNPYLMLFNIFIFVGVITWGAFLSMLASVGKKYLSTDFIIIANKASAVAMVAYGTKNIYPIITKMIF